jgi:hypothetical protein
LKHRRGVSQIIGSLIVLAIVASIGSVILFQGLNQISAFNYDLSFHDKEHNDALREDIVLEHVRFVPNSDQLELYFANIGSIDTTIVTGTVVKVDTQELIVAWEDVPQTNGKNSVILVDDNTKISLTASLPLANPQQWNSSAYNDTSQYKISITTDKGKIFSEVRSPGEDFNS